MIGSPPYKRVQPPKVTVIITQKTALSNEFADIKAVLFYMKRIFTISGGLFIRGIGTGFEAPADTINFP